MKKKDIKIGHVYMAKVSGKIAPVKITGECSYGGWSGTNMKTGRTVHIRGCQRLRYEVFNDTIMQGKE